MPISGYAVIGLIGLVLLAGLIGAAVFLIAMAVPQANVLPINLQNPLVAGIIGLVVAFGIVFLRPGTLIDFLNLLLGP